MKSKERENFLDYIPSYSPQLAWREQRGAVAVEVRHGGFYNKIAQRFFKKPAATWAELDEFGSFVWLCIDGKSTIYALAQLVKGRFGDDAEPLYARISEFFAILRRYKLISFGGKIRP